MSLCRTTRPRPASGSSLVGSTIQWLLAVREIVSVARAVGYTQRTVIEGVSLCAKTLHQVLKKQDRLCAP
jgi:hypothetical protein